MSDPLKEDALENEIGLAMVALERRELDPRAIVKGLRERFGVEATLVKADEPVVFALEGAEAFVVTLPVPLPPGDMETAVARSWQWPDAALALDRHRAHAIVTVASKAGASRLEQALRLSRVVAALASTENALAVYWGAAGVLHEPADFLDEIASAGADYVPVMLWVGMLPFAVKNRKYMGTRGLAQLGHPEIELDLEGPLAPRIVELLPDLMAYVVGSGAKFQDGDTVGSSPTEKFRVRHEKSLRDDERVLFVSPG